MIVGRITKVSRHVPLLIEITWNEVWCVVLIQDVLVKCLGRDLKVGIQVDIDVHTLLLTASLVPYVLLLVTSNWLLMLLLAFVNILVVPISLLVSWFLLLILQRFGASKKSLRILLHQPLIDFMAKISAGCKSRQLKLYFLDKISKKWLLSDL